MPLSLSICLCQSLIDSSFGILCILLYPFQPWLCLQCLDAVGWVAGRASGLYKTEWWGAGMVICLEQVADLRISQLMPLPLTVSCFGEIQIGFTFLVPAHPGSPGKRAVKWMYICFTPVGFCRSKVCSPRAVADSN